MLYIEEHLRLECRVCGEKGCEGFEAWYLLACWWAMNLLTRIFLAAVLMLGAGCASPLQREPLRQPEGPHDLTLDRSRCFEYAERYGVINLNPTLGDKAENQPDRQRRNNLFYYCMQEKGYSF